MQSNRRTVLRYGAALSVVGLAGCTGGNDDVSYPDEDSNGGDGSSGGSDGDSPSEDPGGNETDDGAGNETTDGEGGDQDQENEDQRRDPDDQVNVGPMTDNIVSEARWFARGYEDAVDAFFAEIDSFVDTVETLEAMSLVTEADIESLAASADRLERTVQRQLEPHFSILGRVQQINREHLADIRRHGDRGDQPALETTLAEFRRAYRSKQTQAYIDRRLPRNPIKNRLVGWLKSPWLLRAVGSDNSFKPRPLFEIRYDDGDQYGSFVRSDLAAATAGEPLLRGEPASARGGTEPLPVDEPIEDIFSVVSEPRRRRDRLYVVANEWRAIGEDNYFTERLFSQPIYVQRYRSAEDAEAAVQALLDGPVFLADVGRPVLGGEQWEQIFYRRDGRVRYAAMAQTGPTVIVVDPTRTPIEDRPGFGTDPDITAGEPTYPTADPPYHWARPLSYTWLWNDPTIPDGTQEAPDETEEA